MNRLRNPVAANRHIVTANRTLAMVIAAAVLLFVLGPVRSLYHNHVSASTASARQPNIALSPYVNKPAADEEAPSDDIVAKVADVLKHVPPGVLKRDGGQYKNCNTFNKYPSQVFCESANCVSFYNTFQFWYPGCVSTIAKLEGCFAGPLGGPYELAVECDQRLDPVIENSPFSDILYRVLFAYEKHIVDFDEDDIISRRAHLDQYSEVRSRGEDIPPPVAREHLPPRPLVPHPTGRPHPAPKFSNHGPLTTESAEVLNSNPNRPHLQNLPPRSVEAFVSNHGPVATEGAEVSTLEDRFEQITESTHGVSGNVPIFDQTTQTFICPANKPNGSFCMGSGIIRCNGGIGQPESCDSSLSSQPPAGIANAQCWETSSTSGDATCTKNCIAYPDHGGNFAVPGCKLSSSQSLAKKAIEDIETLPQVVSEPNRSKNSSELEGTTRSESFGPLQWNGKTNAYTCPTSNPNGRFCVGGPFIIRCRNGIGQGGSCCNNLMGMPPFRVKDSSCWETSPGSGDAACSKNCIVYPEDGRPSFNRPNCTPERSDPALDEIGIVDKEKDLTHSETSLDAIGIVEKSKDTTTSETRSLGYNDEANTYVCPANNPSGNFCSTGNIIVRCKKGVAQPGNYNDHLAGAPPLRSAYSPCPETSLTSGDAACSKNCVVYPENGKPSFTLSGCKLYLSTRDIDQDSTPPMMHTIPGWTTRSKRTSRPNRGSPQDGEVKVREIDEESSDLDSIFAPMPKPHISPKLLRPKVAPPQSRIVEGSFVQDNSGIETNGCLRTLQGEYWCDNAHPEGLLSPPRDIKEGSTELDTAEPPRPTYRPKPRPKGPLPPQSRRARAVEESFVQSNSGSELDSACPPRLCNRPKPYDLEDPARKVSEEDRSLHQSESERPAFVIHAFSALPWHNADKDCRGKNDSDLELCRSNVQSKNTRILCIALVLGIVGLLLLSLVILDKIRRAKSRRASPPVLKKSKSLNSIEQMNERSKKMPTSLDGTNDGWSGWLMRRQEKTRQFSPAPRILAPRIPSLTLPKPTLATVRKFSGLGPDMENGGGRSKSKGRWGIDSKMKWSTTI